MNNQDLHHRDYVMKLTQACNSTMARNILKQKIDVYFSTPFFEFTNLPLIVNFNMYIQ